MKYVWVVKIVIIAVMVSAVFTLISSRALAGAGYILSFAVLAVFIIVGIIVDAVGVAVLSAPEASFHAMNSRKTRGAKQALRLIRNAEKVSSICNDVVGDICGIISGAMAALVVTRLLMSVNANELALDMIVSGAVTALTIGGKAVCKPIAMKNTERIVLSVGKLISLFSRAGKK